jgi:hypothetical protein
MNAKFWISVVAMFVLAMAIGFVVHGLVLAPDYAALPNLFRGEAEQQQFFGYMLLAHVPLAFAFVWVYLRGREDKPFVAQGLRYGIAVALLTAVPMYLIYYAVQPMPGMLVVKQIAFDTIGWMVMGVAVAFLNR